MLGLSQQALADRCNISARSQRNYESGERLPDAAYLAALATLGVDVLYILTGRHAAARYTTARSTAGLQVCEPDPPPYLSPISRRERALLDNYEAADEAGKKVIEGTAGLAAQPKAARCGSK